MDVNYDCKCKKEDIDSIPIEKTERFSSAPRGLKHVYDRSQMITTKTLTQVIGSRCVRVLKLL